jgi:nitrogen regulatory protein P-II 1
MKKIECFVRETDLDALVEKLGSSGVSGMTAYPVNGFGRQRGVKGAGTLLPKMKLEVFVLDIEVDNIVALITQLTRQGKFGDGKIAVLPVDDIIRVRTGEKGAKALY